MIRPAAPAGHRLPGAAAPRLDPALARAGVVVGLDGREPLVVRLFRSRPTTVGLFAAGYVAGLLAHRALAVGARVVVLTERAPRWGALVRAAPAGPAWVNVVPPNAPTPPAGTLLRPVLVVDDLGPVVEAQREAAPWQAVLTLRPYLTPRTVTTLPRHDVVVLQRIAAEALRPVQAALGLPPQVAQWLPRMPDDTVAVVRHGQARFVKLAPTAVEQMAFGPPTRHDG